MSAKRLFDSIDPKAGVLNFRLMLAAVGTIYLLRGSVSVWHHEFKLAMILFLALIVVLRRFHGGGQGTAAGRRETRSEQQ